MIGTCGRWDAGLAMVYEEESESGYTLHEGILS